MIAPLLPHELEIGLRQREISNQVGFADFRRKGAQASALRLGKDASRHSYPTHRLSMAAFRSRSMVSRRLWSAISTANTRLVRQG